ncbi:MAG: SUF system Fe-S cluster assembly protein [Alphaproteobacteria bacterium]|jgi:FeS assembly SUF system protein|nr:MAG: SUF system Fe-S cluster assembly protein [Alphaproteobacteria bacterium]
MDGVTPAQTAIPKAELDRITDDLVAQFKTVFDPEIPVDVYELGLIYKVDINDEGFVDIEMTLTAPGCPVAGEMPGWVEDAARKVNGVTGAKVNLVFEPPWTPARMSDEAKLELNML